MNNIWWQADPELNGANQELKLTGSWTLKNYAAIERTIPKKQKASGKAQVKINNQDLDALDTTGAMLLLILVRNFYGEEATIELIHLDPDQSNIIKLVLERFEFTPITIPKKFGMLARTGRATYLWLVYFYHLIAFLGETLSVLGQTCLRPKKLRHKELFVQLERVCYDAVPIVSLVTALIGVVVAYLFAIQLIKYGANIFIVDGVTLAICRELSPIIVAIIMAGRSGSAFTAQIGTMKLNEELDAMMTIGLSPQEVLVIPRLIALVIAMPLLTFVGDLVGLTGGMLITQIYADVSPASFIQRIYTNFPIASLYIGLIKAPVFAILIALIGCQMGFKVENNARSIGLNTTSTVVQSIVLIIIINAAFAVVFAHVGFPGSR